jgi:hypothetical protein
MVGKKSGAKNQRPRLNIWFAYQSPLSLWIFKKDSEVVEKAKSERIRPFKINKSDGWKNKN